MKVVFATAYAPVVGGAERYAQGLAEALAGLGHEVHVLTPNRVSAEAFYTTGYSRAGVASETMGGVAVHRLRLDPPLLSSFGVPATRCFQTPEGSGCGTATSVHSTTRSPISAPK